MFERRGKHIGESGSHEETGTGSGDEGREGLSAGLLLLVALIFACVGFSCGHIRRGLKNAADAEMAETTGENAAMLRLTLESRFALLDNVAEKIAEDPQNAREMLTNLGKYANG